MYAKAIEDPKAPSNGGWPWLAIVNAIWFPMGLYLSAGLPGERSLLLGICVVAVGVVVLVWWIASVGRAIVRRRVRHVSSLLVPVLLALAGLFPWHQRLGGARLHAKSAELVRFLKTKGEIAEGVPVAVPDRVAGLKIITVTRQGTQFVLDMEHTPDSQAGLIYTGFTGTFTPVVRPDWVRNSNQQFLIPGWWEYAWWDE